MKRCSKCDIEKELDQYEKYWHSTQNKFRIRGYCISCFRLQKKQYKESIKKKKIIPPVEDIPPPVTITLQIEVPEHFNDPDYKKCNTCGEYKVILKDFYKHGSGGRSNRCIECQLKIDREQSEQKKIEQGGSMKVKTKPNQYTDIYQKQNTFELMTIMGYLFDEVTGIWYKPGYKEIVDGKPKFVFLKQKPKPEKPILIKRIRGRHRVTEQDREQIISLRLRGKTLWEIECETGLSDTTIWKIMKKYGEETK